MNWESAANQAGPWIQRLVLAGQAGARLSLNPFRRDLFYVVESQGWSIQRDGEAILGALGKLQPGYGSHLTSTPRWLRGQAVHFGSLGCLATGLQYTHRDNHLAATVYHGYEGMDAHFDRNLEVLLSSLERLKVVVTSCKKMERRLRGWGVPGEKIQIIPLGVDLNQFTGLNNQDRLEMRSRLGIPEDSICIGSFQKDGVGWDDGLEPKLIKGPDVFVEAVSRLSRSLSVTVLLTGPARGYVKQGLKAAGVSYVHHYLEDVRDLPRFYNCLDLYLVTSREEGGPKALVEAMASGIPLVSTAVGMAPEMIQPGINGFLTEIEDVDAIVRRAQEVLSDRDLSRSLAEQGRITALDYDWEASARRHHQFVYSSLFAV